MAALEQFETGMGQLPMNGVEIGDRGNTVISPTANEDGHPQGWQSVVEIVSQTRFQLAARTGLPTRFACPECG